jgi:sporulation protein YlmC with PRC-barrel domain
MLSILALGVLAIAFTPRVFTQEEPQAETLQQEGAIEQEASPADAGQSQEQSQEEADESLKDALRVRELIGNEVLNPQGEKLGKIEDVTLDHNLGRIAYAIIAVEPSGESAMSAEPSVASEQPESAASPAEEPPAEELGEQPQSQAPKTAAAGLIVAPFKALSLSDDGAFTLALERSQLSAAPAFDKRGSRSLHERSWCEEIHRFYGEEPYWQEMEEQPLSLAPETAEPGYSSEPPESAASPEIEEQPQSQASETAEHEHGSEPPESAVHSAEEMEKTAQSEYGRHSGSHQVSELLGREVTDRSDKEIGTLEDFVIDAEGKVEYAAISLNGTSGAQSKLIDWEKLHLDHKDNIFALELSESDEASPRL